MDEDLILGHRKQTKWGSENGRFGANKFYGPLNPLIFTVNLKFSPSKIRFEGGRNRDHTNFSRELETQTQKSGQFYSIITDRVDKCPRKTLRLPNFIHFRETFDTW